MKKLNKYLETYNLHKKLCSILAECLKSLQTVGGLRSKEGYSFKYLGGDAYRVDYSYSEEGWSFFNTQESFEKYLEGFSMLFISELTEDLEALLLKEKLRGDL